MWDIANGANQCTWRPYDIEDSNSPFQRMESLRIPSSTSLEDRTELGHGELYLAIKKKIVFWPKG